MRRDFEELEDEPESLIGHTVEIVTAHLQHNNVALADVPGFIKQVHAALDSLRAPAEPEEPIVTPIVPVRQSVKPDHLICLECGKRMQTLKVHLRTKHGLDPHEYIEKYGLPYDYPMVAADYLEQYRQRAIKLNLGAKMRDARDAGRQSTGKPPMKMVGGKHGK